MPHRSPENQEIVRLLGKLKEETPEYPTDLLEARKYAFMKQIVDIHISGEGGTQGRVRGAKPAGGARSGGMGAALGRGATLFGLSLKTALALGAVIVLLAAAVLFRERIVNYLEENGLITTAETAAPPLHSTPAVPAGGTPTAVAAPTFGMPSSGGPATRIAPGAGDNGPAGTPTPSAPGGPAGVFEYLMCVLRGGADICR